MKQYSSLTMYRGEKLNGFCCALYSVIGSEDTRRITRTARTVIAKLLSVLPDWIIIGAQKCGTSTLYTLLNAHPWMQRAAKKEIHYFDVNYFKGQEWYESFFPARENGELTGESTPYLIFHPLAVERVARDMPDVKIFVMLRNPVDRAFSNYQQQRRHGFEPLETFEEGIAAEEERLAGEREKIMAGEDSFNHRHFSYLSRGRYADQIENWLEHFDREQIHIANQQDLTDAPRRTMRQAYEFLDVGRFPELRQPDRRRNEGGYEETMNQETRRYLENYFAPYNQKLYERLGRDFGW